MRLTTRARTRGARGEDAADHIDHIPMILPTVSLEERLQRAYVAHALADALPRRRSWALKRALDLAVALPLALITTPLCLIVALSLWARYRQRPTITWECAVRGGCAYAAPVFRSAPDEEYHEKYHDERRLEVWASASRLVRLPALWSVVSGKMSLSGPAPWPISAYEDAPVTALARLQVAPGLLRLRAVGRLGRLAATEAEADQRYVTHGSLWMDLEQLAAAALMPRTIFSRATPSDA